METTLTKKDIYRYKLMYVVTFAITFLFILYMVYKDVNLINIFNLSLLMIVVVMAMFFDFKMRIIPNEIVLAALVIRIITLGFLMVSDMQIFPKVLMDSILGSVFVLIIMLVARLLNKGIGMGDIKLFAIIGLYLGANMTYNVLFYSILTSFIFAIFALITKKMSIKDTLPLVPFIFIGFVFTMLLGGV